MRILDKILALIAPFECLNCGLEGPLLCANCSNNFPVKKAVCFACRQEIEDLESCINKCTESPINRLYSVGEYAGTAKDLVLKLKASNARQASFSMAILMSKIAEFDKNKLLTHIPTATSRIRIRGYDQSDLLAQELSRLLGCRKVNLLLRINQNRQVGSSKKVRTLNAQKAYRVINKRIIENADILLIDDVMTTGATLEAAAKLLMDNGAKNVDVLVFAVA